MWDSNENFLQCHFFLTYVTSVDLLNSDLCIWDTNILILSTKHKLCDSIVCNVIYFVFTYDLFWAL